MDRQEWTVTMNYREAVPVITYRAYPVSFLSKHATTRCVSHVQPTVSKHLQVPDEYVKEIKSKI